MLAALTDVLFALLAFFFFRLFGPGTEKKKSNIITNEFQSIEFLNLNSHIVSFMGLFRLGYYTHGVEN